MKPNNEFTTPEQRFFFPVNNEVEHHESFDTSNIPKSIVLPGDHSYVLYEDARGKVVGAEGRNSIGNIQSGSQLTGIVTVDEEAPRYHFLSEDEEFAAIANPVATYDLQVDDLAILKIDSDLSRRSGLNTQLGGNRRLVLPITRDARLPYSNGQVSGESDEVVTYLFEGVVKHDGSLLGWPGGATQHAHHLIDFCVALEEAQNRMEIHMVHDAVGGMFASLIGQLSVNEAVTEYLRHFDKTNGTSYVPTKDPVERVFEYRWPTDEDRERCYELFKIAHGFINQTRP